MRHSLESVQEHWDFIRKTLASSGFVDPCTEEEDAYNTYLELLLKQIGKLSIKE